MFLHKKPSLPFSEENWCSPFKGFPKFPLFTKFSLFLTVSEFRYTDFIIGHQNNSFGSGGCKNSAEQ